MFAACTLHADNASAFDVQRSTLHAMERAVQWPSCPQRLQVCAPVGLCHAWLHYGYESRLVLTQNLASLIIDFSSHYLIFNPFILITLADPTLSSIVLLLFTDQAI
ncbi:hypothetical protein NPIL_89511 [Nephila pilipes]|uniref:Uncharacterized protein n=1 Tax=Nephila pilipes TaxID=299642 RepID=A0A8X6N1C1_NEPPI|nr:hypothetical protein NPIL_89511 [Nephila pilipes]